MRWLLVLCVVSCTGCGQWAGRDLEKRFSEAQDSLDHGDLLSAVNKADSGYRRAFFSSDPEWRWKFRYLQAEIFIQRRDGARALALLGGELPKELSRTETAFRVEIDRGSASARLGRFNIADEHFESGARLCASIGNRGWLGELRLRQSLAAYSQGDNSASDQFARESISLAREAHQPFLEAKAMTMMGSVLIQAKYFGQAIDWVTRSLDLARRLGIKTMIEKNLGNLGWCYYNMGDQDRALANLEEADKEAAQLDLIDDRRVFLTDIGLIFLDRDDPATASDFQLRALALARQVGQPQGIATCLHNLGVMAFDRRDFAGAKKFNDEEMQIKRQLGMRASELHGRYLEACIQESQNNHAAAIAIFDEVIKEAGDNLSLKWQAQAFSARVHQAAHEPEKAQEDYDGFLLTAGMARGLAGRDEFKISLRSGLNHYYSEYIQFLMEQGKPAEALKVAETSRALVLSERLGVQSHADFTLTNAQAAAAAFHATILSYWLTPDASYLWVVTPKTFAAFTLPPGPKISELAESYRRSVASSAKFSDTRLFETLIAPAQSYLTPGTRVIVIPDGNLHQINFETLLVPGQPQPHYWIEDVVVSTATSLALLSPHQRTNGVGNILLIGNPNSPGPEFPTLPNAALELHSIADRFPAARKALYEQERAQPSRYLTANPGAYSWIHFAAHGVASTESPLDSAIILSNENDSYKLYARDIAKLPLKADLVTISACYGSGTKTYAGEGIVGLAWAFQLAGAHNVIAALWEANDYYTAQLMDHLYEGLMSGQDAAHALRSAKLNLLHSEYVGRNPRYWGPFQLYTGY
jgi:CHAT domain-containing protein